MKTALQNTVMILALLATVPAASALACDRDDHVTSDFNIDCDGPVHWADRHVGDTRYTMTTTGDEVTLVLTDRVVAMPLSDHVLHKIDRKLKAARDRDEEEGGLLGHTIKVAVLSGVSSLLDHSAEIPLDQVKSVDYRDGRLRILTYDGRHLFEKTHVHDENVLESFHERDAMAFVREFQRAKARATAG